MAVEAQATEACPPLPRGWFYAWAGLLAMAGWPTLATWLETLSRRSWEDNSFQLLTLALLAVAIAQRLKREKALLQPSPDPAGLMALGGLALLHLLGGLLMIRALYWGSFLGVLGAVFWAVFGRSAAGRWLGVFCFSLFLLPEMPTDLKMGLSLPLQLISTQLTAALASLFIPITASGNLFFIQGEPFEVTVACSGLNTWIGFLYAAMLVHLFEDLPFRRLAVLLLAAPVLALVLNAVRLFITALVAYRVSADAGVGLHTNLEYALFPLGLCLLWRLGRRRHAA
jgi:exosortase